MTKTKQTSTGSRYKKRCDDREERANKQQGCQNDTGKTKQRSAVMIEKKEQINSKDVGITHGKQSKEAL